MVNSKRAATYYPELGGAIEHFAEPVSAWRIRWYWRRHVHVSHPMPRHSALALAETMRECGVPTVVIPAIEERRPL
jgi:hypothetical protein